jgi:hypothetical protein
MAQSIVISEKNRMLSDLYLIAYIKEDKPDIDDRYRNGAVSICGRNIVTR